MKSYSVFRCNVMQTPKKVKHRVSLAKAREFIKKHQLRRFFAWYIEEDGTERVVGTYRRLVRYGVAGRIRGRTSR